MNRPDLERIALHRLDPADRHPLIVSQQIIDPAVPPKRGAIAMSEAKVPMTDPYARYTRLKFDRPHQRVLRITMENGRMNTTDATLHAELAEIWRDVDRDASVNAAIITGAGRIFSAGGDFSIIRENIEDFEARARQWKEARDNVRAASGDGLVIGTEYEPEKTRAARAHFEEPRLTRFIDLREGDLRETLRQIDEPVDFMLVDIWIPMARPALELVAPHLRPGAIVVCDNTEQHRVAYAGLFRAHQ
jgi:hypothetical protein